MPAKLRQCIHELCRDYMLGRLDAVFEQVDDEVEFIIHAPPDIVPPHPPQKGKAALGALLLKVQAEFEYLTYRPHVVTGTGNGSSSAAVTIVARLRRRSSGEILDLFITDFVRFRNGRLAELREFVDHMESVDQFLARRSGTAK